MVTYAGGYARKLEDTVTIHCNTVVAAKKCSQRRHPQKHCHPERSGWFAKRSGRGVEGPV